MKLVRSGSDPNNGSPIFDLRGLGTQPLQCLIRALEREATYNHGGRAMRMTCGILGINHSRKAIAEFLR